MGQFPLLPASGDGLQAQALHLSRLRQPNLGAETQWAAPHIPPAPPASFPFPSVQLPGDGSSWTEHHTQACLSSVIQQDEKEPSLESLDHQREVFRLTSQAWGS